MFPQIMDAFSLELGRLLPEELSNPDFYLMLIIELLAIKGILHQAENMIVSWRNDW